MYECFDFAPSLSPILLVHDFVDKAFEIALSDQLLLLLHLDVLAIFLRRKLHAGNTRGGVA